MKTFCRQLMYVQLQLDHFIVCAVVGDRTTRRQCHALGNRVGPDISRVPLIADGSLHDIARAEQMLEEGPDMISVGRSAPSNPDLPRLVEKSMKLREFDPAILGPIANIKDSELELRAQAPQ